MVSDAELVFYLQVYKDYRLADACLSRIRTFYPASRIAVVSDGDPDPRYKAFVSRYGVEYTEGERLYAVEQGGRMLHRMLEIFMRRPAAFFVKMDTDTRIDRRLFRLPAEGYLYGSPSNHGCLQGGCILIPRGVVEKLHRSAVFLSPELEDWESSWGALGAGKTTRKLLSDRAKKMERIGFEWVLRWGCLRLGLESREFGEIHSTWKDECSNEDRRYAFVHPDKYMHAPAAYRFARRLAMKGRARARALKRKWLHGA